jgi:hypothetical protein
MAVSSSMMVFTVLALALVSGSAAAEPAPSIASLVGQVTRTSLQFLL